MEKQDVFQEMADKWPSAAVARTDVGRFSGGLLNSKTLANLDAAGLGCPGRIACGRKVAYPLTGENGLIAWMRARAN
jgi:hypothetical protein